jgi:hypothetical protein
MIERGSCLAGSTRRSRVTCVGESMWPGKQRTYRLVVVLLLPSIEADHFKGLCDGRVRVFRASEPLHSAFSAGIVRSPEWRYRCATRLTRFKNIDRNRLSARIRTWVLRPENSGVLNLRESRRANRQAHPAAACVLPSPPPAARSDVCTSSITLSKSDSSQQRSHYTQCGFLAPATRPRRWSRGVLGSCIPFRTDSRHVNGQRVGTLSSRTTFPVFFQMHK